MCYHSGMNKKVPKIALSLLASYLFLVILMPVTKAEDLPLCTFNDFSCDEWSTCSPFNWPDTLVDGIKTRACHQINCQGLKPGEVAPEQTESCLFATPTCNSWTYSNWSACSSGGNQTRNIISSQPNNCVRGDPVLSQSCSYVPTCTINDWSCTDWSECSANGFKNRECNKTNCQNGVVSPAISQSCIYTAPIASCSADTWSCGDWNSCTTSGIQKRSCNKTFDCRTIATPSPLTTRSCVFETPVYQQPQIPQLNLNAKEEAVLKAVVQIQIWDLSLNKYISWGTGINIGGEFITNYHVAKMVITDPLRYAAFACVTTAINSEPDCKIKLSITKNILGKSIDSPKYNQNADLALLYVDKIRVNNKWKMGVDTVLSDWGVSSIILSEYVKNYGDINVGEHVYSIGYPDYGGGKTIIADGFVKKLITNSNGQKLMLNSIDNWLV